VLYCADRALAPAPDWEPTPTAGERETPAPESMAARESARATALYAGATRTLGA